jgi:hypothetical protein
MARTSLASMKRAVATREPIEVVDHWQPQLVGTVRTPERVQTNAYSFHAPKYNDPEQIVESWCYYPKASELRFNDDGTVTFYPDADRSWTLRFAS